MKLDNKQILTDAVKEADLVLIGIGEEWGVTFDDMLKAQRCYEKMKENYREVFLTRTI